MQKTFLNTPGKQAWFVVLFALLWPLLAVLFPQLLGPDSMSRYVPMADAFAAGDWMYAFHPRVPPLLPVLGGCLSFLSGLPGCVTVPVASVLMLALTGLVLYWLFFRVFGDRVAFWGALAAIVTSRMMGLALLGMRDTGKGLGLALGTYAVVLVLGDAKRWKGYLLGAVAFAVLILVRSDCVLYAACLALAILILEIRRRHFPVRSLAMVVLSVGLIAPYLYYNYLAIGYPVPDFRFGLIMAKYQTCSPVDWLSNPCPMIPIAPSEETVAEPQTPQSPPATLSPQVTTGEPLPFKVYEDNTSASGLAEAFVKGNCLYLLLPALLVMYWRIRRKLWTKMETVLLSVWLGHLVLLIAQVAIFDKKFFFVARYLLPAALLFFGWGVMGYLALYDALRKRFPGALVPRCVTVALAGVLIGFSLDLIADSAKRHYTSPRRMASQLSVRYAAEWIRKDFQSFGQPPYRPDLVVDLYRPPLRPVVLGNDRYFARECTGFLAGGQMAFGSEVPDYILIEKRRESSPNPVYAGFELAEEFALYPDKIYRIYRARALSSLK